MGLQKKHSAALRRLSAKYMNYKPRSQIFTKWEYFCAIREKDADSLPPTSDALELHISQAHYRTTVLYCWMPQFRLRNAWIPKLVDMSLTPYSNQLKAKLLLLELVPKVCTELLQCTCKSCTTRRCTCRWYNITCIPPCGCGSVICGNPLNFVEGSDTEDES